MRADYEALEREYVQGDMSVRQLAADHEIRSWSTVNDQARKRNWREKREKFRAERDRRVYEKTAEREAEIEVDLASQVREQSLTILQAILARYAQRLGSDKPDEQPKISTREAIGAMQQLMVLTGQPTEITENRNFGINLVAELPPELAGALLQLARERRPALGSGMGPTEAALAEGIGT